MINLWHISPVWGFSWVSCEVVASSNIWPSFWATSSVSDGAKMINICDTCMETKH